MEKDEIDRQIDVFEDIGHVDLPVTQVYEDKDQYWKVDLETREVLGSVPAIGVVNYPVRSIELVLDSNHFITGTFLVVSLSDGKVVQELREMSIFKRGKWNSQFVTLPVVEKYAYSLATPPYAMFPPSGHSYSVFNPEKEVKTLVLARSNSIQVWSWNITEGSGKNNLKLEYSFVFKAQIEKLIALSKVSQVLSENEIGVQFHEAFVIFDIKRRKRLRRIKGYTNGNFFPLPPSGELGLYRREKKLDLVVNVTGLLQKGVKGYRKIESLRDAETVAQFEGGERLGRFLILRNSEWGTTEKWLYLLWHLGKEFKRGDSSSPLMTKDVVIDGKAVTFNSYWFHGPQEGMGDFCHCSFHGNDVAFIKGSKENSQLVFFDLATGKVKQTLNVPYISEASAQHLSRNRYIMTIITLPRSKTAVIEYNPEKDKYSIETPFSEGSTTRSLNSALLPASKLQRRILRCYLYEIFVEAVAPIPKDLVGVISGFI